jgi:hypothetical protein
MIKNIRRRISIFISFTIFISTPAPLYARSAEASGLEVDYNLKTLQAHDPLIKEFAEAPWAPPQTGPYEANDPLLDQDPYFMASQSYVAPFAANDLSGTSYRLSRGAIDIQMRGAPRALRLNQPLAPLFEVENFLFLQSTDRSLFTSKVGEDGGEGLFFIDKRYLQTETRKRSDLRPIPVFFVPLSGKGWTGKVHNVSVQPFTTIALRTANGEAVTLDSQIISQMAQVLHNNVVYATIMALKHDPVAAAVARQKFNANTGAPLELPFARIPRGSTAAFGTYFTGVNLDDPSKGISPVSGRSGFNFDLVPRAYASELLSPDVLDRLLTVGKITGTVYMMGLIAQYTLLRERMLERRAFIETQEDAIAAAEGKPLKNRSGALFKVKREFLETIDVFSHGLATLSAGAGITAGFILEYGADRFWGESGRNPNGWIRWGLSKTFLYARKQNEFIGANWQSFYLGVVILGGIDTGGVVAQMLWASPVFFPWVASFMGPEIHERISHEFSGASAANNNVITSEIMRNFTGYFVSGAYSYASSQRQALMEIVRPEVENQFRKEGKNPEDPKHGKDLEKRIEARLELLLIERGLPSNKEFLFSAPSVIRGMAKILGYKVDRESLYRSKDYQQKKKEFASEQERKTYEAKKALHDMISAKMDEAIALAEQYPENRANVERLKKNAEEYKRKSLKQLESESDEESFVLEKARWGLLSHALKQSHQAALELAKAHPNDARLQAALKILKETKDKYHVVLNVLKNPFKVGTALKDALDVRKMLTVLSYEGPVVGAAVKYLDLWKEGKDQPEAAAVAARIYRQALFGLIDGHQGYLRPSLADLEKFGVEARKEAEAAFRSASPEVGFNDADLEIATMEIVKQKVQNAAKAQQDAAWRPEKQDWLERHQRDRAHRLAMIEVQERLPVAVETNPAMEVALACGNAEMICESASDNPPLKAAEEVVAQNPELAAIYKESYAKALTEGVGLHPIEKAQYAPEIAQLEKIADIEQKVLSRTEVDPEYQRALERGDVARLNELPLLSAEFDARMDEALKHDPQALQTYRDLRSHGVDVNKRLEEIRNESGLVEKIAAAAEAEIKDNMENNPGWKNYHAQLDPVGQVRFLTHQYADAFLAKYVEGTVSNSKNVTLTSPAQPGVFQKLRQTKFLKGDGFLARTAKLILRAAESPMDATAYRPGFGNWLRRNIPWYQDAKTNVQLTFRIMWTSLTIGYLAQYYIWQVRFDWPTAFFFLWTGGITSIVHYWLDRLMMNMGIRPMHDTASKVKYSMLYTWLTYPSYIPFFFFYADFKKLWDAYISSPISSVLTSTVQTCEQMLKALF